ncbi:MAG: alpha/beta hydrolase [Syntrophotaleaceae bacterium]
MRGNGPIVKHSSNDRRLRLPDGRRLGYAEFGVLDGQPVIYMHGLPASRLEARIADRAARKVGIRIISPDRPGMGLSDFQTGRTLSAWSEDVGHLADSLYLERFSLLGVSGGGPYALACASSMSRRLRAVGLVGALGPMAVPHLGRSMKPPARFSFHLARNFPRLSRLLYGELIGRLLRQWPDLVTLLLQPAEADRPVLADPDVSVILTNSIKEALRQGGQGPVRDLQLLGEEWDFDLNRIDCPVHLWHGEQDATVPIVMGRYLAHVIPGCQSRFYKKEGHFSLPVGHMEEILSDISSGVGRGSIKNLV